MALCEPWATSADLCSPCNDYSLDAGLLTSSIQMASDTLFILSGQQFSGECTQTLRPCTRRSYGFGGPFRKPVLIGSSWEFPYLACGCNEPDTCGCGNYHYITLPGRPIIDITQVLIDGAAFTDYRVDASSRLVRTDGEAWPCCQDLSLATTELDTWSVTYTYGTPPPELGIRAAAVLACEFYQACEPDFFGGTSECRLPRNMVSLTRQGVSATFLVQELYTPRPGRPMRFGIPEVDIFLATYNPSGNYAPSIVLSADEPDLGIITNT